MFYGELAFGGGSAAGTGMETGYVGEVAQALGTFGDIFAGGPQKRERAARYELEAAQAAERTAALQLQAMHAGTAGGGAGGGAGLGMGKIGAWLKSPSFVMGAPWWSVLGGVVATALILRARR